MVKHFDGFPCFGLQGSFSFSNTSPVVTFFSCFIGKHRENVSGSIFKLLGRHPIGRDSDESFQLIAE